jgi:ribosomal protein L32
MRFATASVEDLPQLSDDDARERLVAMYAAKIPDDWDGDNASMRPTCSTCGVKLTARHNCEVFQAYRQRHSIASDCPDCGLRKRRNHVCKARAGERV